MQYIISITRAQALLQQLRLCVGCFRAGRGVTHLGEIRLRGPLHILKNDFIHFSANIGPLLNRRCGPRMARDAVGLPCGVVLAA
ncbi:MAG TPA: hypothetical protein VIF82_18270 [Burkholderiaceae bacterium]